jgi:hypothetical protein
MIKKHLNYYLSQIPEQLPLCIALVAKLKNPIGNLSLKTDRQTVIT